jgi:hypothetical protein
MYFILSTPLAAIRPAIPLKSLPPTKKTGFKRAPPINILSAKYSGVIAPVEGDAERKLPLVSPSSPSSPTGVKLIYFDKTPLVSVDKVDH